MDCKQEPSISVGLVFLLVKNNILTIILETMQMLNLRRSNRFASVSTLLRICRVVPQFKNVHKKTYLEKTYEKQH